MFNHISIRIGLWMLAAFVSFFLLMFAMGLGHHSELHFFNAIVQLWCMYRAIKIYYSIYPEHIDTYMSGVTQGMATSVIGVGGFSVFMTIFLYMNPVLMNTIRQSSPMGEHLKPFTATLFIVAEGLMIGLIGAYILTRILEVNREKAEPS